MVNVLLKLSTKQDYLTVLASHAKANIVTVAWTLDPDTDFMPVPLAKTSLQLCCTQWPQLKMTTFTCRFVKNTLPNSLDIIIHAAVNMSIL